MKNRNFFTQHSQTFFRGLGIAFSMSALLACTHIGLRGTGGLGVIIERAAGGGQII